MASADHSPVLVQHSILPDAMNLEPPYVQSPDETIRHPAQDAENNGVQTISGEHNSSSTSSAGDVRTPDSETIEPEAPHSVSLRAFVLETAHSVEVQESEAMDTTEDAHPPVDRGEIAETHNSGAPAISSEPLFLTEADSSQIHGQEDPLVEKPAEDNDQTPEWVGYDEDLTVPDEEELKQIDANEHEVSALDISSLEKRVYTEVSDPEYRPVKKIRLSWVIKGVRGTKEQPNHATIINSPYAEVDGNYWQIKFFPRGNKCLSLSAYIKCTRKPPAPDKVVPESTFSYFECSPEEDMGQDVAPKLVTRVMSSIPPVTDPDSMDIEMSKASKEQDTSGNIATTSAVPENDTPQTLQPSINADEADWRVSAQLGMVIYNPAEPRTNTYSSSEHQFNKHNDDWGWTNFVGPWKEIHVRSRGQRKPLLQNDTIAIDAYIQIFDDPTKMLWWHSSQDSEVQWDSKSLTGYFPTGTPPYYHSPAVAGITSYLLLKPFREVLQSVDVSKWKSDSQARPRPFISRLQIILYLMRTMKREEHYVNVKPILDAMRDSGENYSDVKSFLEAFRRSVELELEGEDILLHKLSQIFDAEGQKLDLDDLPVRGMPDVQTSINAMLKTKHFKGSLPNYLPLMLERQYFDAHVREWKLLYDRVVLNDEIDISSFCTDTESARYTLYGFMVHLGQRNSGKFYCIVRPGGPGTKWLAFEDGDGNKIFSYTKRRIQDFEGLEGDELKNFRSTRSTAYMAMYIRTSRFAEYLPTSLEPYALPKWLKPHIDVAYHDEATGSDSKSVADEKTEDDTELDVEVYQDDCAVGRLGLLDMFNLKQDLANPQHLHRLRFPREATVQAVRQEMATRLDIDDTRKIRLFVMSFTGTGSYTSAQFLNGKPSLKLNAFIEHAKPLCFWMCLLKSDDEVKDFGYIDPVQPSTDVTEVMETTLQDAPAELHPDTSMNAPLIEMSDDVEPTEDEALADMEQMSVQEAVAATVVSLARTPSDDNGSTVAIEEVPRDATPLSENNEQPSESTSTDVDNASVVHGHLVDTLQAESNASESPAEAVLTSSAPLAVISQILNAAGLVEVDADSADSSLSSESSANLSEHWSAERSESRGSRPTKNVYGFLQEFEVDEQVFRVQSTFFARFNSRVYEAVRKCLGYDEERKFLVWHRETPLDGSLVGQLATFRDINFNDGVDLVVGDILSPEKVEALQLVGKYADPFDLSRFQRMRLRNHPTAGCAAAKEVKIFEFGGEYYLGPILNGRPHGRKAKRITAQGHTYEGPFVCDKKSGSGGKMIYQNGDRYEGDWKADERHGQGEMTDGRTGNRYVGGFESGKRWGKGVTYWSMADEEARLCQICYTEEIDALFYDCGHVCSCVECAKQCEICPICRASVRQVVKMYWA